MTVNGQFLRNQASEDGRETRSGKLGPIQAPLAPLLTVDDPTKLENSEEQRVLCSRRADPPCLVEETK